MKSRKTLNSIIVIIIFCFAGTRGHEEGRRVQSVDHVLSNCHVMHNLVFRLVQFLKCYILNFISRYLLNSAIHSVII